MRSALLVTAVNLRVLVRIHSLTAVMPSLLATLELARVLASDFGRRPGVAAAAFSEAVALVLVPQQTLAVDLYPLAEWSVNLQVLRATSQPALASLGTAKLDLLSSERQHTAP